MTATIHHGDCLEVLRGMADASVDAIVTDPPYGLSFMGKKWDYDVPSADIWRECLRVLKPGGHLLAFAGTRTQHRMAVNIEDAGFEIRDMIAWVYGSGFPKSHDVSKAIDKAAGETGGRGPMKRGGERLARLVDGKRGGEGRWGDESGRDPFTYAPATDAARQWQGWGTALKPALEPITVARKPLIGTVAENVLTHGTGAINVDGCRVGYASDADKESALAGDAFKRKDTSNKGWSRPWMEDVERVERMNREAKERAQGGRWPANLIHDGSDEVNFTFSGGASESSTLPDLNRQVSSGRRPASPARFFYCAKASKADRDEGLDGFNKRVVNVTEGHGRGAINTSKGGDGLRENRPRANTHPTVKPTALMRYLCRLVTPPRGIVLDPFMGSASTGKAATLEGFQFIGIEREAEYVAIAKARIAKAEAERGEMLPLVEVAA